MQNRLWQGKEGSRKTNEEAHAVEQAEEGSRNCRGGRTGSGKAD